LALLLMWGVCAPRRESGVRRGCGISVRVVQARSDGVFAVGEGKGERREAGRSAGG